MNIKNNNSTQSTRDINKLVNSLYLMAENGSEKGERDAAKLKLTQICMKYGLEYKAGDLRVKKPRKYKFSNSESKLILSQCIFDVVDNANVRDIVGEKYLISESTLLQHTLIIKMYNTFWEDYKRKRRDCIDKFVKEYVQDNNIGLKHT